MSRQLTIIGAILKKDFLLVWPMAVLAAVLPIAQLYLPPPAQGMHPILTLVVILAPALCYLASGVLAFVTVHQDAAASLRHDWLTRPVPRLTMLIAKFTFLFAFVAMPWILRSMVEGLRKDYGLAEVLIENLQLLTPAVLMMIILAIASVTASIVEAIAVVVIMIAVALFMSVAPWPELVLGRRTTIMETGVAWPVGMLLTWLTLLAAGLVLWLQYARRKTGWGRVALAAALVATMVIMNYTPWAPLLGIQSAMAAEPATPTRISVEPGCFDAAAPPPFPKDMFDTEGVKAQAAFTRTTSFPMVSWRQGDIRALSRPVMIATPVTITGGKPQNRFIVDQVTAHLVDAKGRDVSPLRRGISPIPVRREVLVDGSQAVRFNWLMDGERAERLAGAGGRLRFDYWLTSLRPVRSFEFPIDGRRHAVPGLGYCGAKRGGVSIAGPMAGMLEGMFPDDNGRIGVDCLTTGVQPDAIYAQAVEDPASICENCGETNYAPKFWPLGSYRREVGVRGDESAKTMRITTYRMTAHEHRQVFANAIMGDAACPVPRYVAPPKAAVTAPSEAAAPNGTGVTVEITK